MGVENLSSPPVAGSVNEDALFGNLEACRRAGLRNGVPTAFYVQAVGGFGNSYRRPDEGQLTYHMASALAYGFKCVKYWSRFVPDYGTDPENTTYNDYTDAIIGKDGKPTDLYPIAAYLHKRAHTIGPVLVDCEAVEVYHTGKRSTSAAYTKVPETFVAQPEGNAYAILSLLHNSETGEQYLMIVNKNMRSESEMEFVLKDVASVVEIDTRTGEGVSFAAQFPTGIRISVASAEKPDEWTVIYEESGMTRPTTEVPVIRFDPVTASRIKLEVWGGVLSVELCEIEIYNDDGSIPAPPPTSYEELVQVKGENYALGKPPIASGSAYENTVDAWGMIYLTDGKKLVSEANGGSNGWMAQAMPGPNCEPNTCWGGVDLAAVYTINEVHIYPRQGGGFFPSAYEIQISVDGETYETVYATDNDPETGPVCRVFKLESDRPARFVRIVALKLTGGYEPNLGGHLMQISEIEVYWN